MRGSREDVYQRPEPADHGPRLHSPTPPRLVRRYGLVLLASLLATFAILRVLLFVSPDADFNLMGHNIHHLFTGLVLIVLGGVPLAIFRGHSRKVELALIVVAVACLYILGLVAVRIARTQASSSLARPEP